MCIVDWLFVYYNVITYYVVLCTYERLTAATSTCPTRARSPRPPAWVYDIYMCICVYACVCIYIYIYIL